MLRFLRSTAALAVIIILSGLPALAMNFVKVKSNQHAAMHVIIMVERDRDGTPLHAGLCTAYAVGPHTLLTAEHCNLPTNAIYIDTVDRQAIKENRIMSYTITAKVMDHQDHMLLDVSGVYFKHVIELTDHVRPPSQGEFTYQWGNPAGIRDQYREGVVTGIIPGEDINSDEVDAAGDVYLIAEPVVGGDSGSAIFSQEDGQLIGVLTYGIDGGKFAGVYAIEFTQVQIDEARV
jgi:hypothetical protein